MSKKEKFGLNFIKWSDESDHLIHSICRSEIVDKFSHLQFIDRLDIGTCQFLINGIVDAQNGKPYDDNPTSDSIEDIKINYAPPNVMIDQSLIVNMDDFKELLQEWIVFISS